MRVLMFGWEFPPLNSGGLGTACYGITKALSKQSIQITFVLPLGQSNINTDYMRLIIAKDSKLHDFSFDGFAIKHINSLLTPYQNQESYSKALDDKKAILSILGQQNILYGQNLFLEILRYASAASDIAHQEEFDIIHCHDWMTFPAGIASQQIAKKKGLKTPLVAHIHATEFDRTGGNPNNLIYQIEKLGMQKADHIITVSNYTKNIVAEKYQIPREKISVVYNAVQKDQIHPKETFKLKEYYKLVLFLGRITLQKGPDWFLKTAHEVLKKDQSFRFLMVGNGDMYYRVVEQAASLGIADKVFFSDFLRGSDVDRAYQLADLYVMPSVSEPFGITPLESIKNGTPVLISKQSGVSEVLKNALVCDFWDTGKMADQIISTLNDKQRLSELKAKSIQELQSISWDNSALQLISIYDSLKRGGN